MTEKLLEGRLLLYSETGFEGGYLSIQDTKYIIFNSPRFGVESDCQVWDKHDLSRQGVTSNAEVLINDNWLELPDPLCRDKDFKNSTLYCGEQNGDLNADKRLSEKYNFKIKYSIERLNETYGKGNWKIDRKLPYVTLKDGTQLHFGDTPTTIPDRPYGIPQNGITRVTVKWNDNNIEHGIISDELFVKQFDFKGLNMLKNQDILKVFDPISKKVICEGQIDKIPLIIFSQTRQGHFEQSNENPNWEKYFVENYYAELYRE